MAAADASKGAFCAGRLSAFVKMAAAKKNERNGSHGGLPSRIDPQV
jgi:hypothetical protein